MRATAKLLYFTGLAALVVGLATLIMLFSQRQLDREPLLRLPVETDAVFETGPLELDAERVRLAVDLGFRSRAVGEQLLPRGEGGELDLFRLPVHFGVRDANGAVLLSQTLQADAVGKRLVRPRFRQREHAVWHLRRVMSDPVRADAGPLRVEIGLLPDRTFGAELQQADLLVFRTPTLILVRLRSALLLGAAGLGLLLLGLMVELLPALAAGYRRPVPQASAPVAAHRGKLIGTIATAPRRLPPWEEPLQPSVLALK